MTDENGHRSVPIQEERLGGASYVDTASEMGSDAIKGMTPADTGWVLAAVVLMLGLTGMILGANYMSQTVRTENLGKFILQMEENRAEENRRLQEQNETLANALARQSDRMGRQAVEGSRNREIQDVVEGFQPKGE